MKKGARCEISKEALINAILNTYDNSRFLIGEATEADANFYLGISQHKSIFLTKSELQEFIRTKVEDILAPMPGHPDYLVLCNDTYIFRKHINENQIIYTVPPEGYLHLTDRYNANHDVYYRLDKEHKTLSFLLGDKETTLVLVEHSDFVYALRKNAMLCRTTDELEKFINDDSWNPRMIYVGRRALKIKDVV